MRKRLQLALMLTATTAIATSFFSYQSAVRAWAAEGDGRTQSITTDDDTDAKFT